MVDIGSKTGRTRPESIFDELDKFSTKCRPSTFWNSSVQWFWNKVNKSVKYSTLMWWSSCSEQWLWWVRIQINHRAVRIAGYDYCLPSPVSSLPHVPTPHRTKYIIKMDKAHIYFKSCDLCSIFYLYGTMPFKYIHTFATQKGLGCALQDLATWFPLDHVQMHTAWTLCITGATVYPCIHVITEVQLAKYTRVSNNIH